MMEDPAPYKPPSLVPARPCGVASTCGSLLALGSLEWAPSPGGVGAGAVGCRLYLGY